MACSQRGHNAAQLNIGGTGLGSFNDRFWDALTETLLPEPMNQNMSSKTLAPCRWRATSGARTRPI